MTTRWPIPLLGMIACAQSLGLRSVGQLSDGVRLGYATGFDSGLSLDYAYRNRASGRWGVGRWVDRAYLNAVGWRAIRERQTRVRSFIVEAMRDSAEASPSPHLFDVACGGGRYVFDALDEIAGVSPCVTLRDLDPDSVQQARREATRRGLRSVTVEQRDSLNADSFRDMLPRIDVAVASGFYELCDDDATVADSLHALAEATHPGGCLVYTGYLWHPQAATMARTLPRWGGGRCDYRPRPQNALDALITEAGYEVLKTQTDRRGMFTVSLAKRKN